MRKSHYICSVTLVVFLLGYACKLSVSKDTNAIHYTVGRHLRASVAEPNDAYDERVILNPSKVKELTQKGSKNIKKLVEETKTKLNQHVADLRFAKLDKVKSNIFSSSEFKKWAASVTKAHKYNRDESEVAMVTALASHYGDGRLASMLMAAKQGKDTRGTAIHLESVQKNIWAAQGKSADDVFNLLKLDEAGGNLLKKPELDMWISHTRRLKKDPYDLLLFKLNARYDDAGIASMLARAKNDPATKTIAEKLETLQLEKWIKQKKSVVDVFKILKLNIEEGSMVLKNPVLRTWMAYAEMLKKDPVELLFLAFKQTGLDDAAAKTGQFLIVKWSRAGRSGDDIFHLLDLKKAGDGVFENPLWGTWVSYLHFHEHFADDVMFTVLKAHYGNERLTKLVAKASEVTSTKEIATNLQMSMWRMKGQTSDDVFDILKLNKMGDKIFESPELKIWVAYVRKLSSYMRRPNEFSAIVELEKRFGTAKLATMLASSKESAKTAATKEFFSNLQKSQFKMWKLGKKNPTDVSEMLAKSSNLPKGDNAKVIRDYQGYFTSNAAY